MLEIESWQCDNKDKLKPITDILINSVVTIANDFINKCVKYVNKNMNSTSVKQLTQVIFDMAKDIVKDVTNNFRIIDTTKGSDYDIPDL